MSRVRLDIFKCGKEIKTFTEELPSSDIPSLVASIKNIKKDSNDFLTELVNEERSIGSAEHRPQNNSGKRKEEHIIDEDVCKKSKIDQSIVNLLIESNSDPNQNKIFSSIQLALLNILIDETINKLIITNGGLNELTQIAKHLVPLEIKFQNDKHKLLYHDETIEPMSNALFRLIESKIALEIEKAKASFNILKDELNATGHYLSLSNIIELTNHLTEQEKILKEYVINKNTVDYLKQALKEARQYRTKLINDNKLEILEEENKLFNKFVAINAENRYHEKFEKAHFIQVLKKEELKNLEIQNKYNEFEKKRQNEKESTSKMNEIIFINLQNIQDQTVEWMNKYENDLEQVDADIQIIRDKLEVATKRNAETKLVCDTRKKIIEDYKRREIDKKRNEELFKVQTECATYIQAWWRGTIYRLKIKRSIVKKKRPKKGKNKKR